MNYKSFEVDLNNKIKKMKASIKNEWNIQNNDVDILIREYEKLVKRLENKNIIINMMALDLKKDGETKKDVIKEMNFNIGVVRFLTAKVLMEKEKRNHELFEKENEVEE